MFINRVWRRVVGAIPSLAIAVAAVAQPANDNCPGAFPLPLGQVISGTTLTASDGGWSNCASATWPRPDVRYRITIATQAWYTITASSSAYPIQAILYPDQNCTYFFDNGTTCMPGQNTGPNQWVATTLLVLNPGSYALRVGSSTGVQGPFTVSCTQYGPDVIDNCATAFDVSSATDVQGNNLNCSTTLGAPPCSPSVPFYSDTWCRWIRPFSGTLTISRNFNTPAVVGMAIYDGGTGGACPSDQSTFVACNNGASFVAANVQGSHVYFIRFGSDTAGAAAQGLIGFHIAFSPSTGACCSPVGTCILKNATECEALGGTLLGAGVSCTPTGCDLPGACCMFADCTVRFRADCRTMGGAFAGAWTPCGGTACIRPGACCHGSTCETGILARQCTGPHSQFYQASSCVPACCSADYNKSGGVTVQDLFDFLAQYFSQSPYANINGGALTVQDLFDFLGAYFTGCS